jgi:hypothetical protein
VKNRVIPALSAALALAAASPAPAAQWTPMIPGWTVHEVPIALGAVLLDQAIGSIAMDPLSGDMFVIGSVSTTPTDVSLFRVSQSGQVQDFGTVSVGISRPFFDSVHRVVLIPAGSEIARFTEYGTPLPPIAAPPSGGPITAGPDGELYAVCDGGAPPTWLRVMRYDSALSSWVPVRDVAPATGGLEINQLPEQLAFDEAGRLFATRSGVLWRIDDASTLYLGYVLLRAQLAAGSGMALFGGVLFDAGAATPPTPQGFASPSESYVPFGVAVGPGPTVLFLAPIAGGGFALDVFTMGATPTVRRSWGAVKAAAR